MIDLLEGVRVLDFTHVHAGPLCTYQLALMGASVLKVEPVDGGDQMRGMGRGEKSGMSELFLGQNGNKKSIALDIKTDEGLAIVHRLIREHDVLVVNMRPGTPNRLGIGYEEVNAINPKMVYCSITGYGVTGPLSDRAAMDHLMQGESGMFMSTGSQDQPMRVGFAVADASTGVIASSSIVAALVRAQRTGKGAFLDLSMLECCMTLMGLAYYGYFGSGRVPQRPGSDPSAAIGSSGTWETADGVLLVNANNRRNFQRMANAVGKPDLADDPRFATSQLAAQNGAELRAIFGEIFKTNTAVHWDELLHSAGVPSGRLKGVEEIVQNPQLAHRGSIGRFDELPGFEGALRVLGAGFLVDEEPTVPVSPPPHLGEHTTDVLSQLGYSLDAIEALRSQAIIK